MGDRLTDLEARLIVAPNDVLDFNDTTRPIDAARGKGWDEKLIATRLPDADDLVHAQGIQFRVPKLYELSPQEDYTHIIWFAGRGVPDALLPGPTRGAVMGGAGIDDLTLYGRAPHGRDGNGLFNFNGSWSGLIVNGELIWSSNA